MTELCSVWNIQFLSIFAPRNVWNAISLCFNKHLCWKTSMVSVMSSSQGVSTSKTILGAPESLSRVIFRVTAAYGIFAGFSWSRQWLLRRGLRQVPVLSTLSTIWKATFSCSQYWPHSTERIFTALTFVETLPSLFLFHFLWRNLMPVFVA